MTETDHTSFHVRRAHTGDPASLEWIVTRFHPLLLAQARYRLRIGRSACEPEDLVSEVWATTLPKLAELDLTGGHEAATLASFLATTLRNKANNLARRRIRDRANAESGSFELPEETRGALTRAIATETCDRVLTALEELSEAEREVIVLRAIEQVSNGAAATLLGTTPNAVSLRYNRALESLRQKLPNSVFDEL